MPQQFGVWQVAGLGIVVAFRGTASQEDVIIDANISPVPLDAARVTRGDLWTACCVSAQHGILEGNSVKAGSGWDGASFFRRIFSPAHCCSATNRKIFSNAINERPPCKYRRRQNAGVLVLWLQAAACKDSSRSKKHAGRQLTICCLSQ